MADLYADFAERYDLFFGSFSEHDPAVVEFFRRLLVEQGVRRVLDCACGTGRDLHLLHSLGLETVGTDLSAAMLEVARRNLASASLHLPLHQLDYRDLPQRFGREFDAVVCLSTSIAHMPDEQNVLLAFRSMRSVLREDGLLVLSQGTSDRQWREKPRFMLEADTPAFSRLFVIDYLGQRSARYNILDIFRGDDGRDGGQSELKVWSTDYQCLLLRDDQERLLRDAGFRSVEFYGSYGLEPYDKETSRRLIAVARR